MEPLTRDILFEISTKLTLPDLLNFCLTNLRIYKLVYMRNDIWFYKLKEFSENWINLSIKSSKDRYILLYHLNRINKKLDMNSSLEQIYNIEEITCNKILFFPKEIGKLTRLKHLYLGFNLIETVPKEIGYLTNLKKLGLSYNKIQKLPKEIGNLIRLKHLYLNKNLFDEWPKEINGLTNLQKIYLNRNFIKIIPNEITNLICLKELFLGNNPIQKLPDQISNMVNLEKISITS